MQSEKKEKEKTPSLIKKNGQWTPISQQFSYTHGFNIGKPAVLINWFCPGLAGSQLYATCG